MSIFEALRVWGDFFFVSKSNPLWGETERQTERESGRKTENEESGRQAEREESMYCGRVKARRFAAWRPPFPFPTTAIPTLSPHIVFLYAYARPVGRQREGGRQGGREAGREREREVIGKQCPQERQTLLGNNIHDGLRTGHPRYGHCFLPSSLFVSPSPSLVVFKGV